MSVLETSSAPETSYALETIDLAKSFGGIKATDLDKLLAGKIASFSLPVVMKIKEAINRAYESSLAEGLLFERREFHATFALADQKEGMRAFVEKRKPGFKHR